MNPALNDSTIDSATPGLIARFLSGERELLHDLIRPYERLYYRLAFSILRNEHDAEDTVQQAILDIYTHLDQLQDHARFKQWSMRIVQNSARQLWRKHRQNQYESIDEGFDDPTGNPPALPKNYADWRDLPNEAAEKNELRAALNKAIGTLPPLYRQILHLRDVEQLNLAETMLILGIGESAVKTRHHRARLMLREALAPTLSTSRPSFWQRMKGVNPWLAAKQ